MSMALLIQNSGKYFNLACDGKENDWNLPIDKKHFPQRKKQTFHHLTTAREKHAD